MSTPSPATMTPTLSVIDNRGLQVRTLQYNRSLADGQLRCLVTHATQDDVTRASQQRDPRRFSAWLDDSKAAPNLTNIPSLIGQGLRRDSTDSGAQVSLFDIEGRPVWMSDSRGTVNRTDYDQLGRPVTRYTLPAGSSANEEQISARYVYGDNDSQTVSPQDDNLRGVCVRQYDEGGKLTIDRVALSGAVLSSTQTFLLDAENSVDWQGSESSWATVLETTPYLTSTRANALGAMLSQTDAGGHTQSWSYDVSGNQATQSLLLAGQVTSQTLLDSLTYSAAGQVLQEVAGNGVTTSYGYQPETQRLNHITAIRGSDNATLQDLNYSYDPVGNITTLTDTTVATRYFRNQVTNGTRTFSYDALYQLISATGRENQSNTTPQSALLPSLISPVPTDGSQYVNYTRSYAYDDSGNLTKLTHMGGCPYTQVMVTDTLSNRSLRQNSDNSLTPADAGSAIWFDASGNLQQLQSQPSTDNALVWNTDNQLQTVILLSRNSDISQSDREVYQYRGGMRVRKQTRLLTKGSNNLWTVQEVRYLPGLELRTTYQETVTADGSTPSAPTEILQVVTGQAGRSSIRVLHWETTPPSGLSNNAVRYGVDNNIGSQQLELDGDGQTISREEYYPFGGTAVWTARNQIEADYKVVRYSGKERDGTGLYYYGYRYYAPWLCRWVSADPAGEVDGLNLYRMVNNNPTNYRDHLGLVGIEDIATAGTSGYKAYKTYKKINKKYDLIRKKADPLVQAAKSISTLTPGGLIKAGTNHVIDKSVEKSRTKILHGPEHPLNTKYFMKHMHKIKNKEQAREWAGKGALAAQHAPIIGAAIGAAAGYGFSKLASKASRFLGKKLGKASGEVLSNHPVLATGLSVAASVQLTTRMNGGGSRLMATAYAETVVAGRSMTAGSSAPLTQERADIISHASVGAKLLNSENPNPAIKGAAIVAFGLEDKPTARDTENIGYAAALGAEWTGNSISEIADAWLPASVSGYVKSYLTPSLATVGATAYASHVAMERQGGNWIEFD